MGSLPSGARGKKTGWGPGQPSHKTSRIGSDSQEGKCLAPWKQCIRRGFCLGHGSNWGSHSRNTSGGTSGSASESRLSLPQIHSIYPTTTQTPWVPATVRYTVAALRYTENYIESQTRLGDSNIMHRVTHSQTKPRSWTQQCHTDRLPGSSQHPDPRANTPTTPSGSRVLGSGCRSGYEVSLGGAGSLSGLNTWHPWTGKQRRPGGCGAWWGGGRGLGGEDVGWGPRQRGDVSGAPPHATRPG